MTARASTLNWGSAHFMLSATTPRDFPRPDFSGKILPEMAVVGRSNVGKSSLLNVLVAQHDLARVSKTPGRTQAINFFRLGTPAAPKAMLADLPGYGYAKAPPEVQKQWHELCPAYLQGRENLKLVLLLLDARRGLMPGDQPIMDLFTEIDMEMGYAVLPVATKMDTLKKSEQDSVLKHLAQQVAAYEFLPPLGVSSDKNWGIKELRRACEKILFPA